MGVAGFVFRYGFLEELRKVGSMDFLGNVFGRICWNCENIVGFYSLLCGLFCNLKIGEIRGFF